MIIKSVNLKNFSSYQDLTLSFDNKGLTLVSGPTGSGKSTLCDAAPWVLFGKTSKNGTVDEILSWNATGPTVGTLTAITAQGEITVTRSRRPNDLHFSYQGKTNIRGKDLNDTQRLLDLALGLSYDTFIAGAYFHEFSQTAGFFTATAKVRRSIIEQIVDLSMVKTIQENASLYKKEVQKQVTTTTNKLALAENTHRNYSESLTKELNRASKWHTDQKNRKEKLQIELKTFESERDAEIDRTLFELANRTADLNTKIKTLTASLGNRADLLTARDLRQVELNGLEIKICPSCGGNTNNARHIQLVKEISMFDRDLSQSDEALREISRLDDKIHELEQSADLAVSKILARINPFAKQLEEFESIQIGDESETYKHLVSKTATEIVDLKASLLDLKGKSSDAELLQEITDAFRTSLITNAIADLEQRTNNTLSDHYDAEIRVKFDPVATDKIDVTIFKDGNEASYTQLSKGQRQLLKLSFGLAVMDIVQLHNNLSLSAVFLDEALDGLDESLKVKSYHLLEGLSQKYDSVFVVEHNETLKSLFPNRLEVSLINGKSQIEEA